MRRLTGVPCPACGASESVVAMSRGDLAGAAVANPFVFLVVLAVLAAALVPVARRAISDGTRAAGRRPLWVLPVIASAWWYQLHRFDLTG
ncbi:MAG: DUF2752 domain-containing protein [Acidimicrobiales bacterium]|nr:DUF2752 domain-containing protein [Acidimicrobiales bacterium]